LFRKASLTTSIVTDWVLRISIFGPVAAVGRGRPGTGPRVEGRVASEPSTVGAV
jgi:hypothetical protein